MVGYRTLLVGLLIVIGPPAMDYVAGIDWTQYVGPKWGPIIAGSVMIAMRFATTTGVFKK